MSYVYDTATLNAYSYGRLGALAGTRRATVYDDIPVERGKKYRIWFTRPTNADKMWPLVYAGKNVAWRFRSYWNQAYSNRFNVTKDPQLLSDSIYTEGTGAASGETFGRLALDRYWATGNPLYTKGNPAWALVTPLTAVASVILSLLGKWYRRGIEGVSYLKITDADGNDLVQEESYEPPGGTQKSYEPPGGTPGDVTGGIPGTDGIGGLLGGMDTTTLLLIGGVGLLGVLWFMKRKKKKESQ